MKPTLRLRVVQFFAWLLRVRVVPVAEFRSNGTWIKPSNATFRTISLEGRGGFGEEIETSGGVGGTPVSAERPARIFRGTNSEGSEIEVKIECWGSGGGKSAIA